MTNPKKCRKKSCKSQTSAVLKGKKGYKKFRCVECHTEWERK